MKHLRLLTIFTLLTLSLPAYATEQAGAMVFDGDDFGGSYFTTATPDALTDGDDFFSADMLNNIEPAAGDNSGFILPEDAADEATRMINNEAVHNNNGVLQAPEDSIIPGMD